MSLIVDSIFTEWRASLPEGSSHPNTKNGYHLFLLKEICLKRGISEDIVNSVILELEQDTYKLRKKDTGDISVFTNKDNYEKALDSGDYEEPEDGEKKPQIKQDTNQLFQKDGKTDDNLIMFVQIDSRHKIINMNQSAMLQVDEEIDNLIVTQLKLVVYQVTILMVKKGKNQSQKKNYNKKIMRLLMIH